MIKGISIDSEILRRCDRPLPKVGRIVPRVAERYRAMLKRLNETLRHDPERARAALQDAIGDAVTLQPDKSRKSLSAEYGFAGLGAVGVSVSRQQLRSITPRHADRNRPG